jgi:putative flippase GtrA
MSIELRRLLAPDSGILGQGVRYALTGGIVSLVYLSTTTVLALVVGVPFEVALPIGFGLGLVVHFTMQRVFVWRHRDAFALPLHHQVGRYLTLAGTQYGLTAVSTALLPAALGLPTEIVYLATAGLLTSANFLFFRHRIFHARTITAGLPDAGA